MTYSKLHKFFVKLFKCPCYRLIRIHNKESKLNVLPKYIADYLFTIQYNGLGVAIHDMVSRWFPIAADRVRSCGTFGVQSDMGAGIL
jgi:hypothetical protein